MLVIMPFVSEGSVVGTFTLEGSAPPPPSVLVTVVVSYNNGTLREKVIVTRRRVSLDDRSCRQRCRKSVRGEGSCSTIALIERH